MKIVSYLIILSSFLVLWGCGGGSESGKSSSFNVGDNKPIFKSSSIVTIEATEIKNFSFTIEVEDASAISYTLSKNMGTQDFEMFTLDEYKGILKLNMTKFKSDTLKSKYIVVIIATDTVGNRSNQTFTLNIVNASNTMTTPTISTTTPTTTPTISISSTSNQVPIANAGEPTSAIINKVITLRGSGIDYDGKIISYEWSKGNSILSTNATFEYIPTLVGQDKLTLTVIDNDGATASDSVIINIKDVGSYVKWMTPSRNICKEYGGEYYGNQCIANLEDAQIICSTIGASLPTIELLREVVINCGGIINDYSNISNEGYQSCYKEEGFSSSIYWSMTEKDGIFISTLRFSGGNEGWDKETNKFSVRCNK